MTWQEWLGAAAFFVFVYLSVGLAWEKFVDWSWERTLTNHFWHALASVALGIGIGFLSGRLWPERLFPAGRIPGLSLALVPVLSAVAVVALTRAGSRRPMPEGGPHRGWLAFDLGFAAALTRLFLVGLR